MSTATEQPLASKEETPGSVKPGSPKEASDGAIEAQRRLTEDQYSPFATLNS